MDNQVGPAANQGKHLAFFLLCLLMPRPSAGTEIVMVVTSKWVVLAADSLVTSNGVPPHQECKIQQATGQFFWSSAALGADRTTGFDIAEFFKKHVKPGRSAAQVLDAIGADIVSPLEKELPVLQRIAPDFYARVMRGGYILTLFAVGIRGTKIDAYSKDFRVEGQNVVPLKTEACVPAKGQRVCLKVTNTPQVREYADTHPDIWNGDVVSLVDRLMKAGQEADPQNIGPPFSILLITKKGSNWLRQNDCKAIETPSKKSESTKPRAGKYSHAKLNGFHLTSARA